MNRRSMLKSLVAAAVAMKLLPKGKKNRDFVMYGVHTHRGPSYTLTVPQYESIEDAVADFGEDMVLKMLNKSYHIDSQMYSRREMYPS